MKRVTDYEQIREYFLDAMGLVMIVAVGLMVLGIILAVSLNDVKKQKSGENE